MENKINDIKESRSLSVDSIVTLERNIIEAEQKDRFNKSFLFNPYFTKERGTYDPAIQDLIRLYYEEIDIENGSTFDKPSLNNYTESYWEGILTTALNPNGDGMFYPYVPGADVAASISESGVEPSEVGGIISSVDTKVDKVPDATENDLVLFDSEGGIKSSGKTIEEIVIGDLGLENATQVEAETGFTDGLEGSAEEVRLWSPEKIKTSVQNLSHFRYEQDMVSDVWNITHTLGKYPSVSVVETGTNDVIFGKVTYIDINQVQVEFSIPITGVAYLN